MATKNRHLVHLHSNVVTNGEPKKVNSDLIKYGEIAINYASGNEQIQMKNVNNEIVTFSCTDKKLEERDEVIASAFGKLETEKASNIDVNSKIQAINYRIDSETNSINERINSNEEVAAEAFSKLEYEKASKEYVKNAVDEVIEIASSGGDMASFFGGVSNLTYGVEIQYGGGGNCSLPINRLNTLVEIPNNAGTYGSYYHLVISDEAKKYGGFNIIFHNTSGVEREVEIYVSEREYTKLNFDGKIFNLQNSDYLLIEIKLFGSVMSFTAKYLSGGGGNN